MTNIKRGMMGAAGAEYVFPGYDAWGWGPNYSRSTGDATETARLSPVQNAADEQFIDIAAGANFGQAISGKGIIWVWGSNSFGRLGTGGSGNVNSPIPIASAASAFTQISAFTNAAAAVDDLNKLWTWGNGIPSGQNVVTTTHFSSPVQVGSLTDWASVAVGFTHMLAVKTDGTLWSWGDSTAGALGLSGTVLTCSPVQVGAETSWASVAAATNFSAAITTTGKLYTWGDGAQGQLGQGSTSSRSSPIQVGSLTNWSKAALGSNCMGCIKTDGTFWVWGYNGTYGTLGLGNTTTRFTSPNQIGSDTNWAVGAWRDGGGMLTKTTGTLWTWGPGYVKIGDGGTTTRSAPVQIGSYTDWVDLADCSAMRGSLALRGDPPE